MSKSEEYQAHAAECLRRANLTENATDRRAWVNIAENWIELLKFRLRQDTLDET